MADVTYRFDSWSQFSWWEGPQEWVDGSLETFSSTSDDGDSQYLDGNTCPGTDLGTITKVELSAYAYGDGNDNLELTPVFTGGNGDVHETTPSTTASWGVWVDITNDTNAPSPWTWADVENLACFVIYQKSAKANFMYGAQVNIRVTYTIPGEGFVHSQIVIIG